MSKARKALDWNKMLDLALDRRRAKEIRDSSPPQESNLCTMCGEFCALKKVKGVMGEESS
jgi:phosphomethylpyrimidine synthase